MDADVSKLVERSLTVVGYGRLDGGRLTEQTLVRYGRYWTDAQDWLTSLGLSTVTPWSSETLAHYAGVLLEHGYATGTVDVRLSAIRAGHRRRGWPVPDGVAAWYVLRGAKDTAQEGSKVNTSRSRRGPLASAAAHLDATSEAGARDLCWATLGWDLMARTADLVKLDISDVRPTEFGLLVRLRGRWMEVEHIHEPVQVCPVESTLAWLETLHRHQAYAGALFRPVDKGGNIGGTFDPYCGRGSPERLSEGGLAWAWGRLIAQGGLPESTPRDLRLASAMEAATAGVPVAWIIERGGWSWGNRSIIDRLLAAAEMGAQDRDGDEAQGDDDDD